MKMHSRALRELVGENHAHAVALTHAELGAGHLAVVGPGLGLLAGVVFPLDHTAGKFKDLDAIVDLRLERLIAYSLGLDAGEESLDASFVHGVHLVGGHG